MIKTIRQVLSLLSQKERRRMLLVFFVNLLMSVVEVVGITSILPFISIASNAQLIHTNQYLAMAYDLLNFSSERQFLIVFGFLVFFLLIFSNIARAIGSWMTHRFAAMCMY